MKFEKLYQPCILVTKKRYTGYCYMNESSQPLLLWWRVNYSVEGKGIEMIRSDQCEYIQRISKEVLEQVFQGCNEEELHQ